MMLGNRTIKFCRVQGLKPSTDISSTVFPPTVLSAGTVKPLYPVGAGADLFGTVFDLWSDPEDLRYTKVCIGRQGRKEDLERIGSSLRQAAATVIPASALKHG